MKKIQKIDLFNLSKSEIEKREQDAIRGGGTALCVCTVECTCRCSCSYQGPQTDPYDSMFGGSSTADNKNANTDNTAQNQVGAEKVSVAAVYAKA